MPFIANTPESLLGRSDSKNPAITCRGITSIGRPCRRRIGSPGSSPNSSPTALLKARLSLDDVADECLYCWQHKEQASSSVRSSPGSQTCTKPILEERTSLDELADRLSIVALSKKKVSSGPRPRLSAKYSEKPQPKRFAAAPRPKLKKELHFCFCFKVPIEEISPPPRPKPHPSPTPSTSPSKPSQISGKKHSSGLLAPVTQRPYPRPSQSAFSGRSSRNSASTHPSSWQTAQFLNLVPRTASLKTASRLLSELAKPLSQQDEAGYIYMFWLTPESQPSTPPADAVARSLLEQPSRGGPGERQTSDVLATCAVAGPANTRNLHGAGGGPRKVLLKIGRASNVQRRLNEWQRQCGYNVSLIRFYPYIPSADINSSENVPRKMPHSHKVERLIHIELAGLGLRVADREKCGACGREHREWFEADATRKAVADVDDVVRRWVDWDESQV